MNKPLEEKITLADGRVLGYAEYGGSKGKPVFLFHGQPGNRLFHPDIAQVTRSGVRLIVPDRPGYGLSAFQEGRKLLDWPKDVLAIADHLSIDKFSVLGFSGGGPYALVCAHEIPEKLDRALIVAGAPPMDVPELRKKMLPITRLNYALTRYAKPLLRKVFQVYWKLARKNPSNFTEMMKNQVPEEDLIVMGDPEVMKMLLNTWKENLRLDSRGYVYDAELLMSKWGFSIEGIQKLVELWWGTADVNVPLQVMDYFSRRLPNSETNLIPEAGHFGLLMHWERIF